MIYDYIKVLYLYKQNTNVNKLLLQTNYGYRLCNYLQHLLIHFWIKITMKALYQQLLTVWCFSWLISIQIFKIGYKLGKLVSYMSSEQFVFPIYKGDWSRRIQMQRNLDQLWQEGHSRELKEVALQAGLALTQAEYTYIQI